ALSAVEGHHQRCAAAVAGVAIHGDDAQAAVVKGAHQRVAGVVVAGEDTDRGRVAAVCEDLLAPAAYRRGDTLDLLLQVVAGQVVVLHGGDVEVAAAQDRDGEGEVLRGGAVVQAQAAGASADGDPVPAQLHGVRVDALVGVLGDEHVVLALGDERAQHLPL